MLSYGVMRSLLVGTYVEISPKVLFQDKEKIIVLEVIVQCNRVQCTVGKALACMLSTWI